MAMLKQFSMAWLAEWWCSVPSVQKVACLTPPLAAT